MEYFTLSNGMKLPAVGMGTNTFGKEGGVWGGEYNGDFSPVYSAVNLGYRFFDSAIMYINDDGLGDALKNCGIPREELIILSKFLYRDEKNVEEVRSEICKCMDRLKVDYLDLFLIHEPWDNFDMMVQVWQLMEEFYREGKFRAIGVSNFEPAQIQALMDRIEIRPMVNEIPCNGKTLNHENVKWCKEKGIQPIAWGPLSNFTDEARENYAKIGEKYGKSWVQVVLRYQNQRGVCVIPKSHKADRQATNIDIFDFALSDEDMSIIDKSV